MLNRADIRRECRKVTFEKGEELNGRGAVGQLKWKQEREDGFEVIRMTARVGGSKGNTYEVALKLDEDYREILEYECECPAFFAYSGLCKHCVAALLRYMEVRVEGGRRLTSGSWMGSRAAGEDAGAPAPERGAGDGGASGEGRQAAVQKRQPPKQPPVRMTTFGFEGILNQYTLRDKARLMQRAVKGKVRLEPSFELLGESLRVEFKIGSGRMYVLKNIGDFVNAVACRDCVCYGKELEFYHDPEAFAPECGPLVQFLVFSLLRGSSYMGNYLSAVYKRDMAVGGDLIDDFAESIKGLVVSGKLPDEGYREWTVEDGEPERLMEIQGERAGIYLKMDRLPMITGRRYLYFFEEGKIFRADRERVEEIREFLIYMDSFGKNGLYVASSELPAFAGDMLPVLSEHFQVRMQDFNPADYLPEEARFEIYLDAPQKDFITCVLTAVYGEVRYHLFAADGEQNGEAAGALSGEEQAVRRDTRKELEMSGLVSSFFDAFDPERHQMVLEGEDRIYGFLREGLPGLQALCDVYVSDAVKSMRILPAPRVNVGISLAGDLLELSISSEEMPLERLADILSRYDRKRKYYRLKDGSFVDLSDEGLQVISGLREGLGLSEGQLREGRAAVPKYRAMYLDSCLQESAGLELYKNRGFRALVRNMKTAGDSDFEIPPSLAGTLRGYQKMGFRWIKTLKENGFGGILADDMGLGKTLQVIAFLLSEWKEADGEPGKLWLVVCPASLVYNWVSELERFAPVLPVYPAAGTAAERKAMLERAHREGRGVVVTSYDLLRRDLERYEGMDFACQIIDEAQFIKNHTTQAARAVKSISSSFRLALTGTPVENRLSELWSIFDFLMPGFLYSYSRFREELEAPIVMRNEEEAAERLRKLIRPFVLRRLKKDVLTDLPEKIEKNMYAALAGEQKELYDAHVQRLVTLLSDQTEEEFASSQIQVLAELTRLRQLCCDPGLLFEGYRGESAKTQLCMELLKNAVEGGHKVLLFSQFTSQLARLKEAMEAEGIRFFSLEGSTPKAKRLELVERFNRDDTQVFAISLKAGGTGLNLTGADIVIHYDPWWNVAVQNQATDRAHRIGQKNVVTVYRLIARGTIEEKIVALQDKKKELAEQILGQEEMGLKAFTKEALMEILGQR